jgi:aryl-alcohol dehydrogenase-like predicted oxidoreductase
MLTRPIPSTGEDVPVIGLGTWRAFDVGTDEAAWRPLREVLRLFVDAGGRIIDSSPMYGRAEMVTGDLLARGASACLSCDQGMDDGSRARGRADTAIRQAVAGRHHRPDADPQSGRLAHASRKSQADEGRRLDPLYRHHPLHYWSIAGTRAYPRPRARHRLVQLGYSLATRAAESELLQVAAPQGAAVIANQPLERGDMFRRVRGRALPGWAAEFDCASWAQLFLKYILTEPAVTCVIPATGNPEHITDALAAGFGRLPDARQRRQIRALWDAG